ncbi:uncharacterized protein LOC143039246 [Oratosquilla oratoria]|uniref:uncharacterized protein LOC143039246 n=1 Tax=Oratosquilla oratoria TaxID=337810 RepID=UPI003F76DC86
MVQQGIITPVGDEPSECCHPIALVAKNNGVPITVDLTKFNSQVSHPTHPLSTPFTVVHSVTPSSRYFTTADALHFYWKIELAEKDQHLTKFITPYRWYKNCRDPMCFEATGIAYCFLGDIGLQGVTSFIKVVYEIFLFDEDLPSHFRRIHQKLTRCHTYGITLNK